MTMKSIFTDRAISIFIVGFSILFLVLTNAYDDYDFVFYTSAKHAEKATSRQARPRPSVGATVSVTARSLNVRSGPGMNYPVVGRLRQGDVLKVLSDAPDWLFVKLAGVQFGWVKTECTQVTIPPTDERLFPGTSMPILRICISDLKIELWPKSITVYENA